MMALMNKQAAQMQAAREILYTLVQDSGYTFKAVAEHVGELPTTFSKRLKGKQAGYQQLDTALVVNVLGLLGVSFAEFGLRVEARTTELMRSDQ
jgi:hypothetical protein